MRFSVQIATTADIPALSTVSLAAFKDDPCVGYLHRNVPPDKMFEYQCQLFEWRFRTSSLNGLKVFKAVDEETGDILALSRWQFPHRLSDEQKSEKEKLQKDAPLKPEGFNHELEKQIRAGIDGFEQRWVDDSKDFVLLGLATSLSHQRLGLGSLLLRDGLKQADEAGARAFLEAATVAVPLYAKQGFRKVEEVFMDMGLYGGVGVVVVPCMMREAGGR